MLGFGPIAAAAISDSGAAPTGGAATFAAAATASATVSGAALTTSITLAAAGTASATPAAPLTTSISLAAAATGSAVANTPALTTQITPAAAGTASATPAAALTTSILLAAAGTASATPAAALTTAITLAQSAPGTGGSGTAALTTQITPAAAATASATSAAALTTAITLAAAGTASATPAAPLSTSITLAAAGTASATVSNAGLIVGSNLAATATASGTGAAALTTAVTLAATPTGVGTGVSDLTTAITLAVAGTASATGAADLLASSTMAAAGTASATGSVALTSTITLAGVGMGYGSGDATLAEMTSGPITVYANLAAAPTATATGVTDLYQPNDTTVAGTGTAAGTGAAALTTAIRPAAAATASATGAAALTTGISLAAAGTASANSLVILYNPTEMTATGSASATGAAALTAAITLAAVGTASATPAAALTTAIRFAAAGTAVAGQNPDPEWDNVVLLLHAGAMTTDATGPRPVTLVGDYYEIPDSADWDPGTEYTWEGGFTFSAPMHDATETVLIDHAGAFSITLTGPNSSTRNGVRFNWYVGAVPYSFSSGMTALVAGQRYMWGVALVDDVVEFFIDGDRIATGIVPSIDPSTAVLRVHTLTDEVRLTSGYARFLGAYSPETGRLPDNNAYAALSSVNDPLATARTASATGTAALTTAIRLAAVGSGSAVAVAPLTTTIGLAAAGTASATGANTAVVAHLMLAAGTATADAVAPIQTSISLAAAGTASATAGSAGRLTLRNINNVDTSAEVPDERMLMVPARERILYVIPDNAGVGAAGGGGGEVGGGGPAAGGSGGGGTIPAPIPPLLYDRENTATGRVEATGTASALAAAALTTFITLAAMGAAAATATPPTLESLITPLAATGTASATGAGTVSDAVLWTPASLTAPPDLWVNETSPTTESGGVCTQWDDISGNGYDLSSTGTARPAVNASDLNGKRTLTFDGVNDSLVPTSTAWTLMKNVGAGWGLLVVKKTALDGAGTGRVAWAWPTNVSTSSRIRLDLGQAADANKPRAVVRRLDADAAGILTATADTDTGWHMWLVAMDWSAGDGTLYLDGAQETQNLSLTSSGVTSNTSVSTPRLGAAPDSTLPTDMSVAEWIVGAGSLPSAGEIDKLFGYVAHRWGLTASLPGGHPYKTTPP